MASSTSSLHFQHLCDVSLVLFSVVPQLPKTPVPLAATHTFSDIRIVSLVLQKVQVLMWVVKLHMAGDLLGGTLVTTNSRELTVRG